MDTSKQEDIPQLQERHIKSDDSNSFLCVDTSNNVADIFNHPPSLSKGNKKSWRRIPFLQSRNLLAVMLFLTAMILTIFLVVRMVNRDPFNDWESAEQAGKFKKEYMTFPHDTDTSRNSAPKFMVTVDCGSTGSRAYVYRWFEDSSKASLPHFELLSCLKMWPGLSSFGQDLDTLKVYIRTLLHFCATSIGDQLYTKETPVYVFATAGMRLIEEKERTDIMETVLDTILHSSYSFQIHPSQVQIISGQLEGALAWLSVNYMTNTLPEVLKKDASRKTTLGLMDIGGGSMQVAYEVEDIAASEGLVPINFSLLNGAKKEYQIFSKSLLGFGMNEARKKYHRAFQGHSDNVSLACYPRDFQEPSESKAIVKDKLTPFVGSGQFGLCFRQVHHLLKTSSAEETKRTTAIKTKKSIFAKARYVDFLPRPKTPMIVVGVAEYWNSIEDVFHLGTKPDISPSATRSKGEEHLENTIIDPTTLFAKTSAFCSRPWPLILQDVEAGKLDVPNENGASSFEKLRNQCFKSAWTLSLMDIFFGIPTSTDGSSKSSSLTMDIQLVAKNTLGNFPLSWAIGVPILYYHLHPSSVHQKKK